MKIVVLDLDETLVYADESIYNKGDYNVGPYGVLKRPHVDEFLMAIKSKWHIGIWTSSGSEYGPQIVKGLGLESSNLKLMWTGERCTRKLDPETYESVNIKDLKKVKRLGYQIGDIVMVDDSPEKLVRNYGNLVCVRSWRGEPDDNELKYLVKYLEYLDSKGDVTKIEKRGWQTINMDKWCGG